MVVEGGRSGVVRMAGGQVFRGSRGFLRDFGNALNDDDDT